MSEIEDELEVIFRYATGAGDPSDAYGAIAVLDVLFACGLLAADRAALWRARFERTTRPRPRADPQLRERCLAQLERMAADDDTAAVSSLPTHLFEAGLVTPADHYGASSSPPATPPRAVALGPPPEPGGVHVIWIATYEDRIELALRDIPLDRPERTSILLHDSDGIIYPARGQADDDGRCHVSFSLAPPFSDVDLVVDDEVISLDVP